MEDEADEDGTNRPVVVETCPAGHDRGQVLPVQELDGQPHANDADDERVEAQHEMGYQRVPRDHDPVAGEVQRLGSAQVLAGHQPGYGSYPLPDQDDSNESEPPTPPAVPPQGRVEVEPPCGTGDWPLSHLLGNFRGRRPFETQPRTGP